MATRISKATQQNWRRLGTVPGRGRLCSRANKTCSAKHILPTESVEHPENLPAIEAVTEFIRHSGIGVQRGLYSLARRLLLRSVRNPEGMAAFEERYGIRGAEICMEDFPLPQNERDILGVVYQALTPEGERNRLGQYYTPRHVVQRVLSGAEVSAGGYVLDPCCGSGNFLCEIRAEHPSQLLGIDIDPTAAMIATANLMLRYPDTEFVPNIICADFLETELFSAAGQFLRPFRDKIEVICTNPPWGADSRGAEGETFSLFVREGLRILAPGGRLHLLLPDSFGKIKAHRAIRHHLLENTALRSVEYLPPLFSGVVTSCLSLCAENTPDCGAPVTIRNRDSVETVPQATLRRDENATLVARDRTTGSIIEAVRRRGQYTLSDSIWALGIVTGNNKEKVATEPRGPEWQPLCTGKDVTPYRLLPPSHWVRYVRNELQQVAREEIYDAPEKLVYKFISSGLCFAYDDSRVRLLNSANILLPRIPGMGIKTVLGLLNSDLYRFLYSALFPDVKILKGNLCALPFPALTPAEDRLLSSCVEAALRGDSAAHTCLQSHINRLFNLSEEQIIYIQTSLYGNS